MAGDRVEPRDAARNWWDEHAVGFSRMTTAEGLRDVGRAGFVSKRRRRTPWDRILRAAGRGGGVSLSREDVLRLCQGGAIEARAVMDGDCFDAGHDPEVCRRDECGA